MSDEDTTTPLPAPSPGGWLPTERAPLPPPQKVERAPAWLALVSIAAITFAAIVALSGTVIIPLIFAVDPVPEGSALATLGDVVLLGIGAIAGALGTGGNK